MGQIGLFAIVIVASLEFNILVFLPLGNYIRAGGNDALGGLSVIIAILFLRRPHAPRRGLRHK